MSMVHHTLVLPWCEKMRISERLISDVFMKNIWMVLKKCVFLRKNVSNMKYPIGIQTFDKIIEGGYSYVDKTALVYKMAHYAQNLFLSRPRRFGKSLLVSTLQAYFEGRKDLFKGLAIEKMEQEWEVYPVIHIDMSRGKYYQLKNLHAILNGILSNYEDLYHVGTLSENSDVYSERLANIIAAACQQTGKQVVVLIDEYDAPMHDSMNDEKLQNQIRNVLRDFFSPLKQQDANLRFVFITGISKFSQLSIFSELNNLKILTMKNEYTTVCGFTEEEILKKYTEDIEAFAEENEMTYDEAVAAFRNHYDGYHFSEKSPGIYNPFSVINALDDKKLNSYWFSSGTPTFLVELLQKKGLDMLQLDDLWASEKRFDVPTEKISDPIPVLYQSGYLTIKEYDKQSRQYRLGFPNEEVRQGFSTSLFQYYSPDGMGKYDALCRAYSACVVRDGDMRAFLSHLKTFYDKFPYTLVNNNERHYQAVMYTIFAMLGADITPEQPTSDGRIDMVLKTDDCIYIFELKYGKDAETAIAQIENKKYAAAFADDKRGKVLVGINFSEDSRTIDDWSVIER